MLFLDTCLSLSLGGAYTICINLRRILELALVIQYAAYRNASSTRQSVLEINFLGVHNDILLEMKSLSLIKSMSSNNGYNSLTWYHNPVKTLVVRTTEFQNLVVLAIFGQPSFYYILKNCL